jgi:hypothetical protein
MTPVLITRFRFSSFRRRNSLPINLWNKVSLSLLDKTNEDLTQPLPLLHLRIYLRAENGIVNKVLEGDQCVVGTE